jgi:hypothetical protein
LNDQEAKFSQPKRELFRLKQALEVNEYPLISCTELIVETDAKYLYGMLNYSQMGPNATINYWIGNVLMFYFTIKHVAGKTFGPDGSSQRETQPGDKKYPVDEDNREVNPPPRIVLTDRVLPPLEFKDFKDGINSRGGYLQTLATLIDCFSKEIEKGKRNQDMKTLMVNNFIDQEVARNDDDPMLRSQLVNQFIIPTAKSEVDIYIKDHRTKSGKLQDK